MKRVFAFLLLILGVPFVQARDWSDEDLVQDATISCEVQSVVGTSTTRLSRVQATKTLPGLRLSLQSAANFEGQGYRGEIRVVDIGAYMALKDSDGNILSELVWSEYLSGDNIWVTHVLGPQKVVKWLCSYRSTKEKDLFRLKELHTTLKLLVSGLNEVRLLTRRDATPVSVPEACHKIGVALMRAQKLADRSNLNSVGWRARSTISDLRDRVAMEGVSICRGSADMEDVREGLDKILLNIAAVRDAVSPDSYMNPGILKKPNQ